MWKNWGLVLACCGFLMACNTSKNENESVVYVGNPASEYCVDQGGDLAESENDSEINCVLPDGSVIEEWTFFRSKNLPSSDFVSELSVEVSEDQEALLEPTLPNFVPEKLLIKLKPTFFEEDLVELLRQYPGVFVDRDAVQNSATGKFVLKVPANQEVLWQDKLLTKEMFETVEVDWL